MKNENKDLREEIVEALNPEIRELKERIQKQKEEIEELEDWEMEEDEYDEFLDSCYGNIDVAGSSYTTSFVLKNIDEVRYDMGKSEEEDEQRNNKKQEAEDVLAEMEDELQDLISEEE